MGLVKAVERYDLNAPVKFTTFASAWIRGEILNYQREKSFPIKLSRSLWEQSRTLESCRRRLCQELGREPSVGELAAVLETSPKRSPCSWRSRCPLPRCRKRDSPPPRACSWRRNWWSASPFRKG